MIESNDIQLTARHVGLIITFLQFVFATISSYPSQFEPGAPYTLRKTKVPASRWAFIAFMFFGINMLNNWAFAYNISVPVHIILRSFGSVTTMIAGFIREKRYSVLQILSVVLLTMGVLISAWADSESKVSLKTVPPITITLTCLRESQCLSKVTPHHRTLLLGLQSCSLLNSCRLIWARTLRTLTRHMEPAGRRISSILIFSACRYSYLSPGPCKINIRNWQLHHPSVYANICKTAYGIGISSLLQSPTTSFWRHFARLSKTCHKGSCSCSQTP